MKKYNIAVVPLDGVGKQLIPLGAKALAKAAEITGGFELDMQYYEAGVEYAVRTGQGAPPRFKENMEAADAMFNGSVGHYDVEMAKTDYPMFRVGFSAASLFRKGMGNTIGLRPLNLMPGVECPLKKIEKIDVMLIRQLSEGGNRGGLLNNKTAFDTMIVTREETEKLANYAFNLALKRNGRLFDGKKVVSLGNKHGTSACLDFYRQVFGEVAKNYKDVELEYVQIDALAEHLIKDPSRFDVIVCENSQGDIVGDIGAYIAGGMGVTPTADVGGKTPHFRPNHGTFPRAVGKNFANPFAAIITGRLLLDTLGKDRDDEALRAGAKLIQSAIEYNFISGGPRTIDMGGTATTEEAANAIFETMEKIKI